MLILSGIFQDTLRSKFTPKSTKLHHIFLIFSGELAYAPEPLAYVCNYNYYVYFCMKIAIFYSRLFQKSH